MAQRGRGQPQTSAKGPTLLTMSKADRAALVQQLRAAIPMGNGRAQANGQRRAVNARRRRLAAELRANAALRSIPRSLPSQETQFTKGALRTNAFAPRGLGYYDAFAQHPDATVLASGVGPCTPIEAYAHHVMVGKQAITGSYIHSYAAQIRDDKKVESAGLIRNLPDDGDNSSLVIMNPGSSDDIIAAIYTLKRGIVQSPSQGFDPNNTAPVVVDVSYIRASQFSDLQKGDEPNYNSLFHQDAIDGVHPVVHESTGRTETIPLRGSVRIRNITESFQVGGEVRVMRYNGGINVVSDADGAHKANMLGRNDILMALYDHFHSDGGHASLKQGGLTDATGAHSATGHADSTKLNSARTFATNFGESYMDVGTYLEICNMMRQDKRSLCLSGDQLRKTVQSNTYPADAVRSHTFNDDTAFEEALLTPKYSSFIMLIDNFQSSSASQVVGSTPFGRNNSYSLTFTVQRAARYRPGTILYAKSFTLPSNPANHAKETQKESDGSPLKFANLAISAVDAAGKFMQNPLVRKAGARLMEMMP